MKKILKNKYVWIGIAVIFLIVVGVIIYKKFFKEEKENPQLGRPDVFPTGTTGNNHLNSPKELLPMTEIPTAPTALVNRRAEAKVLMKKEGDTFSATKIKVQPYQSYGIFDPDKEVANMPPVVEWKTDTGTYKMLRIEKDGNYYYIAMQNATTGDKVVKEEQDKESGEKSQEIAYSIALTIHDLLRGWTTASEAERVNAIIEQQTPEMLRLINEQYKKIYGVSLRKDLTDEWDGDKTHYKAIQKLIKLGL